MTAQSSHYEPFVAFAGDYSAAALVEDLSVRYGINITLHPSYLAKRVHLAMRVYSPEEAVRALAHALGAVPYRIGPTGWFLAPVSGNPFPLSVSDGFVYFSDGSVDSLSRHSYLNLRGRTIVDGYPVRLDVMPLYTTSVVPPPLAAKPAPVR